MERAVFYARVSTEEEKQLNALSKQVEECRDCIRTQGWALVGEYVDEGKSGTKVRGRDEYRRLFEDLEEDKFDIIVIKSQDRLMRNVKDWYLFLDRMLTHGKKLFIYIDNQFYTSDNALITGIKAILAEEYSRELSKKLNNAHRRRVEKAKAGEDISAVGSPSTYGYDISDGKWVIDEKEAEVVRLIYSRYLIDLSAKKVMEYLNSHGYKNREGRAFNYDTILRILKNEKNKGTLVINRYHRDFDLKRIVTKPEDEWVIVDDAIPALVDKESWEKVNEIIRSRVRAHDGRGKKVGCEKLSGKLYCASCGRVMWGHRGKYKDKTYLYWKCSGQLSKGDALCSDYVRIPENKVREIIKGIVCDLQPRREVVKATMIKWLEDLKESLSGANTSSQRVSGELSKLRQKKERLTDAYLDGIIDKPDYRGRLSEIEALIKELERSVTPVEENEDIRDIEAVIANIDQELDMWISSEDFIENKIDFLIEHSQKITVSKNNLLIIELDLIGGVIIAGEGIFAVCQETKILSRTKVKNYEVELRLAA